MATHTVNSVVERIQHTIDPPHPISRRDPAVPNRIGHGLRCQFRSLHLGVSPTHLERVGGVAPARDREATTFGHRTHLGVGGRVFAVALHRVERGGRVPEPRVPERVGDHRDTPPIVGECDRLACGARARFGPLGGVRPEDEEVAGVRRHLDTGERGDTRGLDGVGRRVVAVVVVRDGDGVQPTALRPPAEQSGAERVERGWPAGEAVEEARVGVEVDGVGRHARRENRGPLESCGANGANGFVCQSRRGGVRVLVRNPNSGDRETSRRAKRLATDRGWEVRDSTGPGGTHDLAAAAAADEDVTAVAACGGDGTLNEVVRGVDDAGALDRVELGVVPAGTGNDFADNLGIRGLKAAFDVLESGDSRRLDLGVATVAGDERVFVNSCVGGLTAEASAKTTPERKRRLGPLAYVLSTLAESRRFGGLQLDVRAGPRGDRLWRGEAVMLLVGNGRRFPGERGKQANMEDGLLNAVIFERAPTIDYLASGAADRLLRRDAGYLTRVKVPRLDVTHTGDPARFSLDGEMLRTNELTLRARAGAMRFRVGPRYDPDPVEWGRTA